MPLPIGSLQVFTVVGSAVIAWLACAAVVTFAKTLQVLDRPTERSSHSTVTPRGGGIGMLVAVLAVFAVQARTRVVGWQEVLPIGGSLIVGLVGWLDDRRSLSVGARLVAHGAAAATMLPLVGWPVLAPPWLESAALAWWWFWGVAMINVTNFMDGIDGLIGLQMAVFGAHLFFLAGATSLAGNLGLALFGGAVGFLAWNWAPARVFLGDVGSGSLGLLCCFGGFLLVRSGQAGVIRAFLPIFPLLIDATVTLLRRSLNGERITQPHRTHLYQRLANGTWGHARASLLYGGVALLGAVIAWRPGPLGSPVWCYLAGVMVLGVGLDRSANAGFGLGSSR